MIARETAMEENEVYIYPKNAKQKLKLARANNQTVYMYGMTVFGKTSLVTHFLLRRKMI